MFKIGDRVRLVRQRSMVDWASASWAACGVVEWVGTDYLLVVWGVGHVCRTFERRDHLSHEDVVTRLARLGHD